MKTSGASEMKAWGRTISSRGDELPFVQRHLRTALEPHRARGEILLISSWNEIGPNDWDGWRYVFPVATASAWLAHGRGRLSDVCSRSCSISDRRSRRGAISIPSRW